MGFGRFVCVAVPFALTLGSLIALLIGGLAGVANKSLFMFEVNTTALSISPSDAASIVTSRSPVPDDSIVTDPGLLSGQGVAGIAAGGNITAPDLGLYDLYQVSLWNFCYVTQNGSSGCSTPQFNWAQNAFNGTQNNFQALSTLSGGTINVPKAITDAINTFATVVKWTEVVFIIAYVALGVELFFGLCTSCSRAVSCLTWLVGVVAAVAVGAAAAMSTGIAAVVTGAVEGSAHQYGVHASMNTGFLAAVWIAVAFAVAAGLFWVFTICCCAPDHHSSRRDRKRFLDQEGEKLMPIGAYQPLHEPQQTGYVQPQTYGYAPQYGAPKQYGQQRSDLAYEPYSHANV
jgi:hypothetical protein